MKKLFSLCLLAAMCAVFPVSAGAEKLDMGKVTCSDFMNMDGDEAGMLYFWLDGYASHMSGNNVIDSGAVEGDMHALMEACQKKPDMKLLDMFKN